jgi:fatty acid desaturase
MKPIIDELYLMIQNKKKPIIINNTSTLEHLVAALLNKKCSQILSKYRFKNLPESLPSIDTNLLSIYYLLRCILICGSIFSVGLIIYLVSFRHQGFNQGFNQGFVQRLIFIIVYGLIAGTSLTSFHVIVHECIHEMFITNKSINHLLGFIISTMMGIPYHSVCFSHAKHHNYVNHMVYGENMIPYNISDDEKDCVKKLIMRMKLRLYGYNRGVFSLINIIMTLMIGVDMYLLFNIGGGRIDYRTKKDINFNSPRDHYRSDSVIFLESQENFVRISTLGIILIWFAVICVFLSYPMTIMCFYIFPRAVSNAWMVIYSWIAHTDINVPYHGAKTFNKFKSDVSVISSSYGLFLDHSHHHIGLNAVIHYLCPSMPHYLCRSFIQMIRDDVLSETKLIEMYNKLDDMYPTYRKLLLCIKSCTNIIKELGIGVNSKSTRPMTHIAMDLEHMTDKEYLTKMCKNGRNPYSIKKLRSMIQNIKKYEKRINNVFREFGLVLTLQNLIEIVGICGHNGDSDNRTVDVATDVDYASQVTYLTFAKKNSPTQDILTLKKFVDMYRYKENTHPIFEKLVKDSIMCQFVEGSMDRTVYYKGFNNVQSARFLFDQQFM